MERNTALFAYKNFTHLPFLCKLRVVVVMQLDQLLGDADQVVVATAAELDEEAVGGDPGGRL